MNGTHEVNPPSPEHGAHEHHHAMPPAADVSCKGLRPRGTTGHAAHGTSGAHDRHEGHSVAMFRDRFWITLLLSIPTLLVFQEGQLKKRLVGAKGKAQLLQDLSEFIG